MKRKGGIANRPTISAHYEDHSAWLAHVVALVAVLVYGVYVFAQKDDTDRQIMVLRQQVTRLEQACFRK